MKKSENLENLKKKLRRTKNKMTKKPMSWPKRIENWRRTSKGGGERGRQYGKEKN